MTSLSRLFSGNSKDNILVKGFPPGRPTILSSGCQLISGVLSTKQGLQSPSTLKGQCDALPRRTQESDLLTHSFVEDSAGTGWRGNNRHYLISAFVSLGLCMCPGGLGIPLGIPQAVSTPGSESYKTQALLPLQTDTLYTADRNDEYGCIIYILLACLMRIILYTFTRFENPSSTI